MIESITIANRDERCKNCKLTVRRVLIIQPSLWQRLWYKVKPYPQIKVDVWYGRNSLWTTGTYLHEQPQGADARIFDEIWFNHCKEKIKAKVKGPYRTTFMRKDGRWELKDSIRLSLLILRPPAGSLEKSKATNHQKS